MNENEEQAFIRGQRVVWTNLLAQCLRELGYESSEAQHAAWIKEREQTIAALREVCAEHGDNDWDDKLHLADIINKHLADYLDE